MEQMSPSDMTRHAAHVADALSVADSTPWMVDQFQATKAEAEGWDTRHLHRTGKAWPRVSHRLRICVDYRTSWRHPPDKLSIGIMWPQDQQGKVHAAYHPVCTTEIQVSRAKPFPVMAREIRRRLLNADTLAVWARCCDEADGASTYMAEQAATIARLVKETGGRAATSNGRMTAGASGLYHTSPLIRGIEVQGANVVINTSSLPADLAIRLIRMIQEYERAEATQKPDNWAKWDTAADTLGTKTATTRQEK